MSSSPSVVPSSPAAPAEQPSWPEVVRHLWPVLLMGLFMMLLYLPGFHRPEPHHVPVAVVGTTEQADRLAVSLSSGLGDRVDVQRLPDQDVADRALRELTVSGAVAPVEDGVQLSVAGAASDTTASVVERMVRHGVEAQGGRVEVRDVAPLPEEDPAGQNAFFTLVVLSVASYSLSIGIGAAAARRRMRDRVLGGLVGSLAVTAAVLLVAVGGLGMFEGHVAAVAGTSLLLSATIMLVGLGVHALIGRLTTMIMATTFVAMSFTSSGGVFEPALQPHLFGWLHGFWIGSGYVQTLTRVLYFPETSPGGPLAILLGWLLLGVLLVAAGAAVERRRAAAQPAGRARPEVAPTPRAVREEAALEQELEEDVAV